MIITFIVILGIEFILLILENLKLVGATFILIVKKTIKLIKKS